MKNFSLKPERWTGARGWALILLISVLLRAGVALYLGDVVDAPPLLTDQRSYHALGVRLLAGKGYTFAEAWYPFTAPETPTAHWSFLYPLFVAAIYGVTGVHPLAVRLVQAVLGGLLLPWLVGRLARRLFPEKPSWSLAAGGLAAGYGYFILYAATLMTETFFIIAVLWSFDAALRLRQRTSRKQHIAIGVGLELGLSLGVSALLRQSILPWVPVLFLWLLWQGRRAHNLKAPLRTVLIAGLVLLLSILPWTYRNYRVYNSFLLLNSNTGYAMYSAQNPMHGDAFGEFDAAPVPSALWGKSEAEIDRLLMQQGIQFVMDDPLRYLRLSLSRARAYVEFWPSPDTSLLHNVGRVGSFGLMLPLMLYGLYLTLTRDEGGGLTSTAGLVYLFACVYSTMHILTWAMVRYRLPVDAVALPFAGRAVIRLGTRGALHVRNYLNRSITDFYSKQNISTG
jgi:hypothetical protein